MFRTFFLLFVLVVTLSFVGCGSKSGKLKSSMVKTVSDSSKVTDTLIVAKMQIISSGNTVFINNSYLPFCKVGEKFVIVRTRTGWNLSSADIMRDTTLRISDQDLDFRIAKVSEIIRTPKAISALD